MHLRSATLALAALSLTLHAQQPASLPLAKQLPTDPKALKSYQDAEILFRKHEYVFALDGFRKADKQADGHCGACASRILDAALPVGDFKAAEQASQELLALASTPDQQAEAHMDRVDLLLAQGKAKKKPQCFADGTTEADTALTLKPGDAHALYLKGLCLANGQQDDEARKTFSLLEAKLKPGSLDNERIGRYIERPELARARLAPAFRVTTLDGKTVSMDQLRNKVVLIDFWATWCGPCREALPGLKKLAQKFQNEPFVVLSISLDSDEAKWKDFVAKNDMNWVQYRDGGWNGSIAKLFQVNAIPHTFTIDADGVLQDERIGDEGLDGKIKKLIAQAKQRMEAVPSNGVASSSQQ